jgi:hypothetical protein
MAHRIGRWTLALAIATLGAWCTGCTSARTTVCNEPGCPHPRKHLHGVPTNVEVPTHVKIVIQEKYYLTANSALVVDGLGQPLTARGATYDLVRKKELFAVDCKRPAAGVIKYKYGFNDNQQLEAFETGVTDVTIEKVSDLVDQIIRTAPLLARPQVTGDQAAPPRKATELTNDIACAFFDIHDPELTARIQDFLTRHLNDCPPNCPGVIGKDKKPAQASPTK